MYKYMLNSVRSLYAIKTIRAHGLDGNALWDVTRATLVAQLLYASPAWRGFLKADEKSHLQSVVKKAQRYGCLPTPLKTLDELRQELDENLFHSSRYNPHHVLYTGSYRHPNTQATCFMRALTT